MDILSVTAGELPEYTEHLRRLFTDARIIDRETVTQLCSGEIRNGAEGHEGNGDFWREHRECIDCVCCRAYADHGRHTKLGLSGDEVYQVIAQYIEIDGEGAVLEIINRLDGDIDVVADRGELISRIADHRDEIYRDIMTGAYNRRYYEERLRRFPLTAGVAMIDIDDFKVYNDVYGHDTGDAVLSAVGEALLSGIRKTDSLIRYGGDEFLLIMPGIPENIFARELRRICGEVSLMSVPGHENIRVTVSVGGLVSHGERAEEAVSRADALMYRAKNRKNVVVTDGDGTGEDIRMTERATALIADDAQINREILGDMLRPEFNIISASGGEECISTLEKYGAAISLVLLDINMPLVNGFDVLEYMNRTRLIDEVPVVMITADDSDSTVKLAYELGATDLIRRPFDEKVIRQRVDNIVKLYAKQKHLFAMVSDRMSERDRNARFLVGIVSGMESLLSGTEYDAAFRVGQIVRMIFGELGDSVSAYGIDGRDIANICAVAVMHDIGKAGIPTEILHKNGALTAEEFETVKKHTVIGSELVRAMREKYEAPVSRWLYEVCRWHHERWDGKGYPDGLLGDDIPLSAQVTALADVYDALRTDRPYRRAVPHDEAVRMIKAGECGAFSPRLLYCLDRISGSLRAMTDVYETPVGTASGK